ncbi:MAG TPA: ATP-grasp domain-containing protein [Candidatus Sulfotelmatobacter sp.]|nr:ATP-grasp domain-containing protein [Candidatus Sulfotelmatobacter sp.]
MNGSGRVMLVLPTRTYRASPFLAAADRLGIDVVIASNEPSSLAPFMEGRYLTVDLGRPEEGAQRAATLARRRPLDAVLGVDESSVLTAAHIAAALGVRHNPVEAVKATRDKRLLRAALAWAGVSQPAFIEMTGDPQRVADEVARAVGLPCVIKPVDGAASWGVIRADDPDSLRAAAARVHALLENPEAGPDGACRTGEHRPLLVEGFVPGPEVAVEGLLDEGELHVLAIFDKPDPMDGPYFEETLLITPSRLPPPRQQEVVDATRRAVAALGLRHGPIHAELRVGRSQPDVIEVASRSIGGHCARVLRFAGGASLEELILRQALRMPLPDLRLGAGAAGVYMLPVPQHGILERVRGVDVARQLPDVDEVAITIPPGEEVFPLPEGDRYLGFVFAHGGSPESVETSLRSARALLEPDIRQRAPGAEQPGNGSDGEQPQGGDPARRGGSTVSGVERDQQVEGQPTDHQGAERASPLAPR